MKTEEGFSFTTIDHTEFYDWLKGTGGRYKGLLKIITGFRFVIIYPTNS